MAEQTTPTYLIVGNGIAGATAAEILRAEDSAATVTVIADDPFPVYYRPALKDYLAGRVREDKLWARPTSFYQDHNILFLPDRVTAIQPVQHAVQLRSGRQLAYTRLLLASGARAAALRCPGLDLAGVSTLRSVADYQALLNNLKSTRRVVVSGSGTLALETVETLRHRGFPVTHLVRRRTLWSEVLDETASDLVIQQERRDGVDLRLEEEIAEIVGKHGDVVGVVTSSGKHISCEVVVIAIGVEPTIDYVKSAGVKANRGVLVDAQMRTNVFDIYAAGDILETPDAASGRSRVIGQWFPAIQQARAAAYSMLDLLDASRPFNPGTFYNATCLYGLDFSSVGSVNAKGVQEIVADPRPRVYRKVLLKEGIPVGMISIGDRKRSLPFKRAIDHRVNLSPVASRLFADDFKLNEWLDRQGVPPALLGVTRSGDVAAQKVAYASGQSVVGVTVLHPEPLAEALLVPISDSPSDGRAQETRLSQTQVVTIGRQEGIHLLIDHPTVSRRHAEIRFANGQYILSDLNSSNGTFVNDVRMPPSSTHVLAPKDRVRFGKAQRFSFILRPIANAARKSSPGMTMVGVTMIQNSTVNSIEDMPLGQPVLNPDGSLLLPGATVPLPASVVATFNASPALVVLPASANGARPPLVYLLKSGKQIVIGREKGNAIELADMAISRYHAEVFPGPDGFYIRDLGSSNGVVVNQTKIDNPYLLAHGDRVSLGSNLIYYIDLQASHGVSAPVPVAAAARGQAAAPARGPVSNGQQTTGSQLIVCRQCGVANMPVARFCAGCSAPLVS